MELIKEAECLSQVEIEDSCNTSLDSNDSLIQT